MQTISLTPQANEIALRLKNIERSKAAQILAKVKSETLGTKSDLNNGTSIHCIIKKFEHT